MMSGGGSSNASIKAAVAEPAANEQFLHTISFQFARPMKVGDGTFEYGVAAGADYLASLIKSITFTPDQLAEKIKFVAKRSKGLTPSREAMLERISTLGKGKLPLRISAPPQGVVFSRNDGSLGFPLLKIESTSEPELPLFLETLIESIIWYTSAVATNALHYRIIIEDALAKTVDPNVIRLINWYRLWDFLSRGVPGPMSSAIAGHSVLFATDGTDTDAGTALAEQLFPSDFDSAGNEVIIGLNLDTALEHADMMKYGKDVQTRVIKEACADTKGGILAFPIDTVDTLECIDMCTQNTLIRELLMNRYDASKPLNINTLRPDSCLIDPATGTKMSHAETIVTILKRIETNVEDLTAKGEGITVNSKGFKVLPSHLGKAWFRLIYGDSLSKKTIKEICDAMIVAGWSIENIIFGVGGNLGQRGLDRGMLDVAQKPVRYVSVNMVTGELITRDLKKYTAGKQSPTGPQKLVKLLDESYRMVAVDDPVYPQPDEMRVIYDYSYGMEEPMLYNRDSLGTIRGRIMKYVNKVVYSKYPESCPPLIMYKEPSSIEMGMYGPIFRGTLPPFAENFADFVDFYKNTQSLDSIGHLDKSNPDAVAAYEKQKAELPAKALAISMEYAARYIRRYM